MQAIPWISAGRQYRHLYRNLRVGWGASGIPIRLGQLRLAATWSSTGPAEDTSSIRAPYLDLTAVEDEVQHSNDTRKSHGHSPLPELFFEAGIDFTERGSPNLTDPVVRSRRFDLWLLLLRASQKRWGATRGAQLTWHAMIRGGDRVAFDTSDPTAVILLRTFVAAGIDDPQLMWRICVDFVGSKQDSHKLFHEAIGILLQKKPQNARTYSHILGKRCLLRAEDILQLFHSACTSDNVRALTHFCEVYLTLPRFKLYDAVLTYLWQKNRSSDAYLMHKFLLSHQDLPTKFEVLQPFIRDIAETTGKIEPFLLGLKASGISFEAQARRFYIVERSRITGYSPQSLNILASKSWVAQSSKFSDEIIARAFATPAFSFDFTLNGLKLLGLTEVGPLAIRQMAITAGNAPTMKARFEKLRELEIDTGSSKFVKVVSAVCASGNSDLLASIVGCDLHHDVFEDRGLQRNLLVSYYRTGDTAQLNRTLAILNNGERSATTDQASSNLVLKVALKLEDWPGALRIITHMRQKQQKTSATAVNDLLGALLPENAERWFRRQPNTDHVGFVIGMLQQMLAAGSHVQITLWKRPLKELGRQHRFEELQALTFWIAEWYSEHGLNEAYLDVPLSGKECDLSRLFSNKFQQAVLAWSFLSLDFSTLQPPTEEDNWSLQSTPWLRGAQLIKILHEKYGVETDVKYLHTVFLSRLKMLVDSNEIVHTASHDVGIPAERVSLRTCLASWASFWAIEEPAEWIKLHERRLQSRAHVHEEEAAARRLPYWRRNRLSEYDNSPAKSEAPGNDWLTGGDGKNVKEGGNSDVVVYRDLFTASWEDYKK